MLLFKLNNFNYQQEKNNKETVEWNALQEIFPTQNNQPIIKRFLVVLY